MDFKLPALDEFSLHVTIYIAPSNVPTFLKAIKPVLDKVAAEPECLYFEMFQDAEDEGKISWVENWSASPEWFMKEQVTKEYYKEYFEITEPMFVKPREVKFLKRVKAPFVAYKPQNFS